MAALGVDLVSACRGLEKKVITGATGVYGRGCRVATSITGGVAALGMSMYGDLLDNDVSAEMWKNAAIRGGLSHGNCFCNAGKFSKQS
jgi:hypothetical protein